MTNKNHNVQDEQLNDAVEAVEVEAVEGEFVESEQELYAARIAELEAALLAKDAEVNEVKMRHYVHALKAKTFVVVLSKKLIKRVNTH